MADKYELYDLNGELVTLKTDEDASVRELQEHVNTKIVDSVIQESSTIVADPKSVYDVLMGDSVSPERRVRLEDSLQSAGIRVDSLTQDFVSHVTVWTHIKDHLEIDTGREKPISIEEGKQLINSARSREEGQIENVLKRLDSLNNFEANDIDVTVTVRVFCNECNSSFRLEALLDNGGCDC